MRSDLARRAWAVLAAAIMLFTLTTNVFANAANPDTITTAVNGNTVTLSGRWDWQSQSYPCIDSRFVGWAVAWDDATQPGNPVPGKNKGDPDWLVGTPTDNAVHTNNDCGDGADAGGKAHGSWGPISHTYPGPGTYHVCVLMYDIHHDKNGQPNKASELVAGGPDHNKDNSSETNGLTPGGQPGQACIPTTIVIPGDVVAKKVVDKAVADPGDVLNYTITLQNTGQAPVTGVDVTDDISPIVPAHGTFQSSNPAATLNGSTLTWSGLTVDPGQTVTLTYAVKLATSGWPNGTTDLPNVVVVQKSSNCKAGSNDPNCTTITKITPNPGLNVVKTADNATVAAGSQIGFTITASNTGNTTLTNVQLSDPLPTIAGLGINWSVAASSPANSCNVAGGNLSCNFGDLAAGASASVHVTSPTTAPAGGGANPLPNCTIQVKGHTANLDNTATVTSGNTSRTDRDGICVTNPGLTVVKTADNASVAAGSQIGFTITATNSGNTTLPAVTLSDPLPTIAGLGMNWSVASSSPANTCAVTGNGGLSCTFGDLAPGASASVHVISPTTAPAGGGANPLPNCQIQVKGHTANLDNTATVTTGNTTRTDRDGICITNPGLSVVKTADNASVVAGNQIGFTITAGNTGNTTLAGVSLSDPLPTTPGAGIAWSVASSSPANACSIAGTTLSCTFGDLAPGASASVHVTSPTTAPPAGGANQLPDCTIQVKGHTANLDNTATVTSGAISRTDRDGICLTSTPHISVTKTPDTANVLAGNPVGFTITVKSDGSGTAKAVGFTDALPTLSGLGIGWSISPAYAGPGTCSIQGAAPGQSLVCAFGDLASGSQASVHVTSPTSAPANGGAVAACQITVVTYATNLNNAVQVTSSTAASATAQTGICLSLNPNPAIHVVKTANPTQLPVGGGPVTYTYAVTNAGNVPLSNVTLVDDKCSPVVFLNGDTNGDARLDLSETWHYSCTANITVTTTNTVVATGHYVDPNDPAKTDHTVTDRDQATVVVPVPTPTPTGSVQGATSPPKPTVTLPPTDASGPMGSSGGQTGLVMILVLLAGIAAAVPILAFGKRRQVRR